jgi:hypothetical protein
MKRPDSELFYAGVGPLAAIWLGMALIPLRGYTSASNLAFAFVALTIVVAEWGGPVAALATAVAASLSLDFFLTEPYLRLSIASKHDVIAFAGLAACGLIAAGLSAERARRLAALSSAARHGELFHSVVSEWNGAAPVEPQLSRALASILHGFPLAAAVVRDDRDCVLAGGPAAGLRPIPGQVLAPGNLAAPAGAAMTPPGEPPPLPKEGGRIALDAGSGAVGWLDVWGDGAPASAEARRALSDVARLLAFELAASRRTAAPAAPRP